MKEKKRKKKEERRVERKKKKKKKGKVEEITLKKTLEKPTFCNYGIPLTTTLLTFFWDNYRLQRHVYKNLILSQHDHYSSRKGWPCFGQQ